MVVGRQTDRVQSRQLDRPADDLHVCELVAGLNERPELVDGGVVLHSVAELLRDVTGVVGERLCSSTARQPS